MSDDILTPEQVLRRETIEFELAALASEAYRLEALADTSVKRARELRIEYARLQWANREMLRAWKSEEEKAAFWARQAVIEEETDGDEVKA